MLRGDWSAAWASFRSAVALEGGVPEALYWGIVGAAQGDERRARLGYEKAVREGGGAAALFLEGMALVASDPSQAIELLGQAQQAIASESPLAPQAIYWQARALERLGRVKEARSTLRFLLRSYPGYGPARDELNRLGP